MDAKLHPVCELFPLMNKSDFEALKADIQQNGIREPVVFWNGWLIDGKNRLLACEELGIECPRSEWDGRGSVVAWAVSRNLRRRHLTTSERAIIAQQMLDLIKAESKAGRRKAHDPEAASTDKKADSESKNAIFEIGPIGPICDLPDNRKATAIAAAAVGVSRTTVTRARRIAQAAPEKIEEIREGKKTVHAAEKEVIAESRAASAPVDGEGRAVTDENLWPVFNDSRHKELLRDIQRVRKQLKELADAIVGVFVPFSQIDAHLQAASSAIKFSRPYAPCPACKHGCKACKDSRWVPKLVFDGFPEKMRK